MKTLTESSLTRLYKQSLKHDCGTITAYRTARDCNTGKKYTTEEKKARNLELRNKLLSLGYSVTHIKGYYIENYNTINAIEVKEESYFVVDIADSGKLKIDLIRLGKEYEQDSVTYQVVNTGKYYLISTNTCTNGYPGRGKIGVEVLLGSSIFGKNGEFYSRVKGRPFVFESCENESYKLLDFGPTEVRSIIETTKEWR